MVHRRSVPPTNVPRAASSNAAARSIASILGPTPRLVLVTIATGVQMLGASPARAACVADLHEGADRCHLSDPIHGGETQARSFCNDAEDWTSFNACAGRTYVLTTESLEPSADTILELFGPDCTALLASNDDGGGGMASKIVWSAPGSGLYHVRIRQKDGSIGDARGYAIHLAGDVDSCATYARSYALNPTAVGVTAAPVSDGGTLLLSTYTSASRGSEPAVARLDAAGNVLWRQSLGTTGDDNAVRAVQTADGGFLVVGWSSAMVWAVKLLPTGAIEWQMRYNITLYFIPSRWGLVATGDGGAALAFSSLTNPFNTRDVFVLKIGTTGTIEWAESLDGDFDDEVYALDRTPDGGFRVIGGIQDVPASDWSARLLSTGWRAETRWIGAGDAAGAAAGNSGYFFLGPSCCSSALVLVKVPDSGQTLWGLNLDGQLAHRTVATMPDGGAVIAAQIGPPSGERDIWVGRASPAGTLLWQKRYGQTGVAEDVAIVGVTADGGVRLLVQRPGSPPTAVLLQTDAEGRIRSCADWQDATLPSSTTVNNWTPYEGEFWSYGQSSDVTPWTAAVTAGPLPVKTEVCSCAHPTYSGMLKVRRTGGASQVYWTAGGASRFDLVHGSIGVLESTGGDFDAALDALPGGGCLADDTSALQVNDPDGPQSPGDGLFYVLRPVNAACSLGGTYDSGSSSQAVPRDPGIATGSGSCP